MWGRGYCWFKSKIFFTNGIVKGVSNQLLDF